MTTWNIFKLNISQILMNGIEIEGIISIGGNWMLEFSWERDVESYDFCVVAAFIYQTAHCKICSILTLMEYFKLFNILKICSTKISPTLAQTYIKLRRSMHTSLPGWLIKHNKLSISSSNGSLWLLVWPVPSKFDILPVPNLNLNWINPWKLWI